MDDTRTRHLAGVWNPSYGTDVMESHIVLLREKAERHKAGQLDEESEQRFRDGVPLMGRRTLPAGLRLIQKAENPWYEVKLSEGRNNQIRMMFKHFGKLVEKLRRVRIGPLELGSLKPGEYRYLSEDEVKKLKRAVERSGARKAV